MAVCNVPVLQYLTSLLLAACEGKTVTAHNLKMYTECGYIPLIIFLGAKSLLIFSFKPRPLFPRFPLISELYGFNILFACFGKGENPCWESKQVLSVSQPVVCSLH